MARLAYNAGDAAAAMQLCDRILTLAPTDTQTLSMRGWLAYEYSKDLAGTALSVVVCVCVCVCCWFG